MRLYDYPAGMTAREYDEYLLSDAWKSKRAVVLARDRYRCTVCGAKGVALEVHHLAYAERRELETLDFLTTVCVPCHRAWHKVAFRRWKRQEARGRPDKRGCKPRTDRQAVKVALRRGEY